MNYNFDEVIDRTGTGAYKYGRLEEFFGRKDLLPLWVADMDFRTPECIMDAIRERLSHPVLGYICDPDDWKPSVIDWEKSHYNWTINPDHLCFINGIMKGVGLAISRFVPEGCKVIVQPPVYHMFKYVIDGNRREIVYNPLKEREDGLYEMDFDNLEQVIDDKCRVLLLANPHNPGGVCWSRETLQRLAEICAAHNIIIISDEIHADMAIFGHNHIPFASVSETAAQNSITFGAPTKVFNMPSVISAWAVVPNEHLRHEFIDWLEGLELLDSNLLAMPAAIAAYRKGDDWRRAMLRYVEENVQFVENYCAKHMPLIRPVRPEASFLIWLDCRSMGISQEELVNMFVNQARVAFNIGTIFGPGGEGHMRLNVATQRATLTEALERVRSAYEQLKTKA